MKMWLRQVLASIKNWWKRRRRFHVFNGVSTYESDADPTPAVLARQLVLIGSSGKSKWLRFTCPCRCGNIIALNLMKTYHPHWGITINEEGAVSVSPSVDATFCGSHFWIRKNRIEWV